MKLWVHAYVLLVALVVGISVDRHSYGIAAGVSIIAIYVLLDPNNREKKQ